eukprot:GEMP01045487.1.p1 GENE.GEMP01045487.1~~GEMP01045487.1.p1  ORF type:complete len:303 (+),score=46.59 GEMP01045487.1:110-1018(+)
MFLVILAAAVDPVLAKEYNITIDNNNRELKCASKAFHGAYLAYRNNRTKLDCVSLGYNGLWYSLNNDDPDTGLGARLSITEDLQSMILLGRVEWNTKKMEMFARRYGELNWVIFGYKSGDLNVSINFSTKQMTVTGVFFTHDDGASTLSLSDKVASLNLDYQLMSIFTVVALLLMIGGFVMMWRHKVVTRQRQNAAKCGKRKMKQETVRRYLLTRKMEWYRIDNRGREVGPVSEMQMRAWFENGQLCPQSLVRLSCMSYYMSIRSMFTQLSGAFREPANIDVDAILDSASSLSMTDSSMNER